MYASCASEAVSGRAGDEKTGNALSWRMQAGQSYH